MTEKRKGNTTNSRRDSTAIKGYSKRYHEEIDGYQKFATARRNMRKYTQEGLYEIYKSICEYVEETSAKGKPLTVAGLMLASGTNKDFMSKARNGDYDYLLEEYIVLNSIDDADVEIVDGLPCHVTSDSIVALIPCSDVINRALLLVQQRLEENCYTNKGNPVGSIFALKAQFKWREDDTPQHVVNQLVIADLEQAQKALEMLK